MKKSKKRLLSLVLAIMLIISSPITTIAGQTEEINNDNLVVNEVVEVEDDTENSSPNDNNLDGDVPNENIDEELPDEQLEEEENKSDGEDGILDQIIELPLTELEEPQKLFDESEMFRLDYSKLIEVSSFAELKEAIEVNEYTAKVPKIKIQNDIYMEETITIETSMDISGVSGVRLYGGNNGKPMFIIKKSEKIVPIDPTNPSLGVTELPTPGTVSFNNISFEDSGESVISFVNPGLYSATTLHLTNVEFNNNRANKGAAINIVSNSTTMVVLEDVTFINNTALANGGAIYLENGASPEDSSFEETNIVVSDNNVEFINNTASENGGAIYHKGLNGNGVSMMFYSSIFEGNTANDGGAIMMEDSSNSGLNIGENTILNGNKAKYGGALALKNLEDSTISINSETEFRNNTANDGGAIYAVNLLETEFDIESSSLSGNKATGKATVCGLNNGYGGAIYLENYNSEEYIVDMYSVSFENNYANANGGAIALSNIDFTDDGNEDYDKLQLGYDDDRVIFANNEAGNGFFSLNPTEYTNLSNVHGLRTGYDIDVSKVGDYGNYAYNNYDVSFVNGLYVKYDGNGNTSGTAPIDSNNPYEKNSTVKVLDKGDLKKDGYEFLGWKAESGTLYKYEDTFEIVENTVLCAEWKKIEKPVTPEKPDPWIPEWDVTPELNKEDHYAYLVGYPDNTVKPEDNITRAEVSTIFFRMMTNDSRNKYWSTDNSYGDVKTTSWYNNAISTLSNANAINGYPDGSFKPNAKITRGEFATMASRFLSESGNLTNNKFTDVKGNWAENAINKLASLGLIKGYSDGSFKPNQEITRAEAVMLMNSVLERAPHKDELLSGMKTWSDNSNRDAWYYAQIQEATNSHKYTRKSKSSIETWKELLPIRNWTDLEKEWSNSNTSKNYGEVMK
ncbi:MAG: hypothetical protein GXZ08_00620 [Tissierellia bacterium]|nr:hypothetical protein [Tissierellia bacterium]